MCSTVFDEMCICDNVFKGIKLQVMKCVLLEIDCFEILDLINFLENVVEQVLSAVLKKVSDFLNVTKNGQCNAIVLMVKKV